MSKQLFIQDSVIIRNGKVIVNGKIIHETDADQKLSSFLKSIYKKQNFKYPKFFKMDSLSKLGYLASEILFKNKEPESKTALVFSNAASSLDTDKAYAETMNDFPSPSVFVYTLPNIMLGEISIRFQLRSENIFLINEEFDPGYYIDYSKVLFEEGKASKIVCGWVDLHNSDYDVFLCQISPGEGYDFNEEELKKLYLPTHE
ncbi:3-oxoacyl-ACP synthase [Gramella jeungdoensis]|uniref:3-oxoacyl-ACP synthase n=1 Tax=Gramella jeungdoensis TaxID=708091 RepID=A0ABT0Z5J0_9FLAO|nr:3-oxoacyl-ACP synthase [Gramella jeungdoensis]MCM8570044.1 3-oxoacyl-ACP synthase [Gramella jeungdoensis]